MGSLITDYCYLAQTGGGANVFVYFADSNFAGKIIVIALILLSLLAWTVMIGKYLDLARLRTLNLSFEQGLERVSSVLQINIQGQAQGLGPYAALTEDSVAAVAKHRHLANGNQAICVGHMENALQRSVARQTIRYESKMVLLGSIVAGAPFMGLLGTVWGVMDAFGSMALQSSATLQNLAPGVSGALLTTVAALLVAIPSVFGYNFLLTQTKMVVTELENYASTLADRIELELQEDGTHIS